LLGLPLPSFADFYYKFPLLNLFLYLEILKVFLRVLYHIWNKLCSCITRVCIYNKGLPTFKQVGASEYALIHYISNSQVLLNLTRKGLWNKFTNEFKNSKVNIC